MSGIGFPIGRPIGFTIGRGVGDREGFSPSSGTSGDAILMESSGYILKEDGSKILKE